ncbi:ParB N-terminal domain-containing protein [Sulfitobacter sp. B30-2]|uniref:ParB N-terminal domain-containing protein n=1 Tax=Sulfitobacter sp. B30-2 TaxID=2785912 RepID=UPI0018CEF54F|nr:ParB N-terminal domain-containing protein [Sulfitobacter sp. B30-2]QPO08273.1 hypothetical protein IT972_12120 [Sulfitobacter sp. B30-2]
MVDYLELTVDELLLDEDNPRLGSVGSQSEALETLIHLNPTHFRNMMLSIKKNGLDPGDNLYVIEAGEDGDYIVLDGNRRLSALKVLSGPDVLDGTNAPSSMKKSLLRAASGFDINQLDAIRCACFKDRAEAEEWIFRRHTGDMDGEGRINWGRTEIQRFTGDRSVLDVIDFVGRNADFTDDEWETTRSTIESKKSSNIGRLLESAAGREHIGISISKDSDGHKTPLLSRDPKWALAVLKQILEDVRDGVVDSRSHNTASEIEAYFKALPVELQPKGNKVAQKAFRDISVKSPPAAPPRAVKSAPKTKGAPRMRKTLAPKKNSFNPPDSEKGKRLLREATMIDADKLTISAAFVLRAFVELAVSDFMAQKNMPKTKPGKDGNLVDLTLSQRAEAVIQRITLDRTASNDDLRGFRNNVVNKTGPSSLQSLNGFVHNKYQIPTPEAVRAGWDSSVPVFEAAYGKV